jgi:hypothetical protein
MKLFIAALGLASLTATSAFATTNLVYPVTGDAFRAQLPADQLNLYYDYGYLYNTGTYEFFAEAPLGHGDGSQLSFTVAGYNSSSSPVKCGLTVRNNFTEQAVPGADTTWVGSGFFNLAMTSPSAYPGDWSYIVDCRIQPNSGQIIFGVTPTGTLSYFTPLTGDSLHGFTEQQQEANVIYDRGAVFTTTGPVWLEGSLGYGQGGNQGFYFNGYNYTGTSMTCYVEVIDYTNFSSHQYSATTSGVGWIHLLVSTTPPAGNYIYTAGCLVPAGNQALLLTGVTPGSGNINVFLPTSGDGFHAQHPNASNLDYVQDLYAASNSQTVEASLGHYIGAGAVTWTVTGRSTGGTVSCTVTARGQVANSGIFTYTKSTTAAGYFSLPIATSPPNNNYVYSMTCSLAQAGSYILGAIPNM